MTVGFIVAVRPMLDLEPEWIYESPDGGDTIYRRRTGSDQRELIQTGPLHQARLRSQLWRDIFQAAESDAELQHLIDRVEIYHRLKTQTQP